MSIACLHGICGHGECFMRVEAQSGGAVALTVSDLAKIPPACEQQSGGSVGLTMEDLFREW